jgi:hypothetical protein
MALLGLEGALKHYYYYAGCNATPFPRTAVPTAWLLLWLLSTQVVGNSQGQVPAQLPWIDCGIVLLTPYRYRSCSWDTLCTYIVVA